MALQEILRIAERQIALEGLELVIESGKEIDRVSEAMAARGLGSSSSLLRAIADVYKKRVEDHAAKVGDVFTTLLDTSSMTYFTPGEVATVIQFANARFKPDPPESLISALCLKALRIDGSGLIEKLQEDFIASQRHASQKLNNRIEAYFLGKRDILPRIGKFLSHPVVASALAYVGGFLTSGCGLRQDRR